MAIKESEKLLEKVFQELSGELFGGGSEQRDLSNLYKEARSNRPGLLKHYPSLPRADYQLLAGLYNHPLSLSNPKGLRIPQSLGVWNKKNLPASIYESPVNPHLASKFRINYTPTDPKFKSLQGLTYWEAAQTKLGTEYLERLTGYKTRGGGKPEKPKPIMFGERGKKSKTKYKPEGWGLRKYAAKQALFLKDREQYLKRIGVSIANPNISMSGLEKGTKGYHLTPLSNIKSIAKKGLLPMYGSHRDWSIYDAFEKNPHFKHPALPMPYAKHGQAFGSYFSLDSPEVGRLPRAGSELFPSSKAGPQKVGLVRADIPSLAKKGYIHPIEIAKRLSPDVPINRELVPRVMHQEIQAAKRIPAKHLDVGWTTTGWGGKSPGTSINKLSRISIPLLLLSLILPIFMGKK